MTDQKVPGLDDPTRLQDIIMVFVEEDTNQFQSGVQQNHSMTSAINHEQVCFIITEYRQVARYFKVLRVTHV